MPAYKLAIFDFDGTLADSAQWVKRAINEAAGRFGFRPVTEAEVDQLRGRSNREIIAHLGVPLWKLPRIAAHIRRRMSEDAEQIRLFPGAPELLERLAGRGLRTAIVSSNSEQNVRQILGAQNAARIGHFECGASLFGKARRLKAAIRRSGCTARETLCIGDETRDIEAAREAGADSGAVLWGYATAEVLARFEPTMTFVQMLDIARIAEPSSP